MSRKVHLRPVRPIMVGTTTTACGRLLVPAPGCNTAQAVVDFGALDATIHGTLVTCARCLEGTKHDPTHHP